uniref:Small ribosomal subunit protein uS3m n=1 Tax=Sanghuangporus vaninii TaxID=175686 RepID=A0A7H1DSK9_9AGAM|nr:ribosomal protein S3 [Sanghuangporus vaninii]YP_010714050.1 ribosomal protein S3 [Fuscoporia gilva]QNS39967.1 ribosomal protein S3 [Sanghuangporus vaninii]WDD39613.1 ribosomal protein S3 [Fuscoporia gilva]
MINNKNNNNINNTKYVETNTAIKSSSNNKELVFLNALNNLKSNITQEFYNNINNLKTKTTDLNSVSINKKSIKIYILNNKLINLEKKQKLKISQLSNLKDSILTFSSLLKSLDQNFSKFELNNLDVNSPNLYEKDLKNNNCLKKSRSLISYAPNPKMESSGLFMSLSSSKDFYFYLVNALNYLNKNKNLIFSDKNLKTTKENNRILTFKIRQYLNLLTKYNFNLATSNYDFFHFKKSNNHLFKMEKATELLNLAFLAKGCLISKPIFNVVFPQENKINEGHNSNNNKLKSNNKIYNKPKIIIHLFYYIKTKVLEQNLSSAMQSSDLNKNLNLDIQKNNVGGKKNLEELNNNIISTTLNNNKNRNITTIYNDKFVYLCDYLSKLFDTEIELDLVRLYKPYQDSNILVQYLNSQSYNSNFIRMVSRLFKKVKIYNKKHTFNLLSLQELKNNKNSNPIIFNEPVSFPSGVSGINIKLGGRPMKERIIPRFTVKRAQRGNFDRLNAKMIEKSMFIDKTKKGSFNFTVRLSHIFR